MSYERDDAGWDDDGVDAAAFDLLLTPRGQRLLTAAMSAYDGHDPLTLTSRLRDLDGRYPAEQVAAALTQVTLRRAAADRFGDAAARMYFTADGLQQATHPVVAAHRAERVRTAGGGALVDLGCGIGSDLAAFARAGFAVTGVDIDEVTCKVAAANLVALDLAGLTRVARAENVDLRPYDVAFADPARRRGTTRLFDPRAFSPPWGHVLGLLGPGVDEAPRRAVVKLAPGLDHRLIPPHVEAEWVSLDGNLKEVALWSPAAGRVRRRASLLRSGGTAAECTDESLPPGPPSVRDVGAFVYEPDPAVIRAHLVAAVAEQVTGWLLDPHIAYVSSDRQVATALARGFLVIDVLPFKERALRAALRARHVGSPTIKKRGVVVTPEELRRRLALRGDEAATLILTRTPRSAAALLVEPLD